MCKMKILKVKCRFRYSDFIDDWEKIELDRDKNCIYIEKNILWNTKMYVYPPEGEIHSFFTKLERMLKNKELDDDFYLSTGAADFGFCLTVINEGGGLETLEFHTNNHYNRFVKALLGHLYLALGYCFPKAIEYPIIQERTENNTKGEN